MKSITAILTLMWCCGAWAGDDPEIQGKTVGQWITQLRGDIRGFQMRAARALAEAPTNARPAIMKQVIPVLKSPRENDKFVAAQVLGEYGAISRPAIPDLLPMLKGTEYERNRAAAAKALGQILKDAEPCEEVEKVAQALACKIDNEYDKYEDVRRESVCALGLIGPAAKSTIPKMARVLMEVGPNGQMTDVRRATATALGRMGPLAAEHVDRLIAMLHERWSHRMPEVPEALGLVGPVHENVIPNLLDAYEENNTRYPAASSGVRIQVMRALARFGVKSAPAVPLIKRLLPLLSGDAHSLRLRTQMLRVLASVGSEAKPALPEIEAQLALKIGKPKDMIQADYDWSVREFQAAAAAAYKAVSGQEPSGEKR